MNPIRPMADHIEAAARARRAWIEIARAGAPIDKLNLMARSMEAQQAQLDMRERAVAEMQRGATLLRMLADVYDKAPEAMRASFPDFPWPEDGADD